MIAAKLSAELVSGSRSALARAISLVESTKEADITLAEAVLGALPTPQSTGMRIGISGPPGAGKSTVLEALGMWLVEQGMKIAVLAVDPSSTLTHGSILGDKTRMPKLSVHKKAFVRPSPSGGILGGVSGRTAESIKLCEAAGYDVVFIETIGIGQNEVAVTELVDLLVLVLDPGAGDDLQGIKRGSLEFVDILAVNKADGDLVNAATMLQQQFSGSLSALNNFRTIPGESLCMSARDGAGIPELWEKILRRHGLMKNSGVLELKRVRQSERGLWRAAEALLIDTFRNNNSVQETIKRLLPQLISRKKTPSQATREICALYLGSKT